MIHQVDAGDVAGVSDAWEKNSGQWLAWARAPGHDVFFWELNLPAFMELAPQAGRRTLDVGCGEGRLGRWLAERGHRMFGIDSSPSLARRAADAGGYEQVECADASTLPWPDRHFDAAIAFMSLQDMPHPELAIGETARVLEPGGVLLIAIVHPLNPVCNHDSYFADTRYTEVVERNGLSMTFTGVDRPLERYTLALSDSGFVIEHLREPRPTAAAIARAPELAVAAARPFFLHLRCSLTHRLIVGA